MERTQLFKIVVSFGSVSSSISLPCYMSHASIPADVRAARGLPDDLVRISVGIEDPRDLIRGTPCCLDCRLPMRWMAVLPDGLRHGRQLGLQHSKTCLHICIYIYIMYMWMYLPSGCTCG